jgi:hypothetical protein
MTIPSAGPPLDANRSRWLVLRAQGVMVVLDIGGPGYPVSFTGLAT